MHIDVRTMGLCLFCVIAPGLLSGCYEELESSQTQAPPPADSSETGVMSQTVGQGGGSALAGAKRGATNVVNQAEQRSREDAKNADDPAAPAPETPADDDDQ